MRKLVSLILCAALVVGAAGCLVGRERVVPGGDATGASAPGPAVAAPRGEPSSRPEATGSQASTPPPAAEPLARAKVAQDAAQADAELQREGARHPRPLISNLDARGEPLPGTTGADDAGPGSGTIAWSESAKDDDELAQGAPGANASAEALARAWPGASVARDPGPPSAPGGAEPEYDDGDDPMPPAAGTELDPSAFERPLRSYGRWIDTTDQGRVWIPYVDDDWQPYSDGVWSDTEYGWAFSSYEPWGWAVFHYGRWGFRAGVGWYWVPGRVWGPAWVSWRWGGGYACWRPMAPRGAWNRTDGRFGARGWVGVPAAHFTEPIYASSALRGRAVKQAVARAAPLPGPRARPAAGDGYGPPVGPIAQASGHPVVAQPATAVLREAHIAARSAAAQERRAGGAPGFSSPRSTGTPNWRTALPPGPARGGARPGAPAAHGGSSSGRGGAPTPGEGPGHGAPIAHPVEPGAHRAGSGSTPRGAAGGGHAGGHPLGRGARGHRRGAR